MNSQKIREARDLAAHLRKRHKDLVMTPDLILNVAERVEKLCDYIEKLEKGEMKNAA